MFLGNLLKKDNIFTLSKHGQKFQSVQLLNAALSKQSKEADLYIKINDIQILICELNRSLNLLHANLNLIFNLEDKPILISRNGDIHICGYYSKHVQNKNSLGNNSVAQAQINTNKKYNSLESKFSKAQTYQPQSQTKPKRLSVNQQQKGKQSNQSQQIAPRQSSRLSSRRNSTPTIQKLVQKVKQSEKQPKKEQKSSKKEQKSVLNNGRYSLKALLENISDEDEDSDDDFSDQGQDQQSEEDSQFQQDEDQEEQLAPKKGKKIFGETKSFSKEKSQQQNHLKTKNQNKDKKEISSVNKEDNSDRTDKNNHKAAIQIGEQQQDQKASLRTQQFQEKWPENPQAQIERQNNKIKSRIQQLTTKIKCPTKKPTI